MTLVGAIDDATGRMTAATFRDQEDAAGYLIVLRETVRRHGVPVALYRDRHSLFETPTSGLQTLEEQLADTRTPTQLGRYSSPRFASASDSTSAAPSQRKVHSSASRRFSQKTIGISR